MSKTFYITTSIPYLNSKAHIGHVLEFVQADALARHKRTSGKETFFLTGTDEHGAKIARAAESAGLEPRAFVDSLADSFKQVLGLINTSNDDFIRTTDQRKHWPSVIKIWKELESGGDLYKKLYKGLYCIGHEAFVTDKDLENGICRDHKAKPEVIEEENWFFRLSKYSNQIESKIKNDELKIIPETRKNEILALLKDGLEDVSFSRPSKDLSWGIPVPGDKTQTIYVWADALTNYISALGYADDSEKFKKFWPADVHLIGKDILRFHAAIWPGMLLSAGLLLPKSILVHGFITVDGEKMSKTVGNIVDPIELVKKYGTDAVRYYLLSEIPSGEDGDFSIQKFENRYNGNLANGLGNYAARVLTLAHNAKTTKDYAKPTNREVEEATEKAKEAVGKKIDEFKLHEALAAIWELISFGDKYINENKPWAKSVKDGRSKEPSSRAIGPNDPGTRSGEAVIYNALYILENVAELLRPFLPETAQKILDAIEHKSNATILAKKITSLFPRLQQKR